jgi:hypothetical protein
MMHVKYKLREPKDLVTPKGPSFSRAKTITCDIDGTVIKFKAPKHRPMFPMDPIKPKREYKMDDIFFRSTYSEGFSVSDNWEAYELFFRSWAFYGPWFTGALAKLNMFFGLVRPTNNENEDFSLFHPRAFENFVGDYLTHNYSMRKNELMNNRHEYIAPVNWQPLTGFPVVATRLEIRPDIEVARHLVEYFVFFPIADKVMARIQFSPSQIFALSQKELDKRVSRSTMLELMENIIDSIHVELSPQAQAQQQAALAGLDDASLIKEFPPLNWQTNKVKQDDFKGLEKNT